MFTLHTSTDDNATFHFDAEGQTPRRWHAVNSNGKWVFVTDMCYSKDRKPGIPTPLKNTAFGSKDEAIAAVLALNN